MKQMIIQKYGKRQKESHFYKESPWAQLMIHDNFNNPCELNKLLFSHYKVENCGNVRNSKAQINEI